MDGTAKRSAWLKGPAFPCDPAAPALAHPLRLVLLGAPGVGKGTQAELLAAGRGACHLSTGDVFRTALADPSARTDALDEAIACMTHGHLVPDTTVLEIFHERAGCLHCAGGFLLDGFPRTVPQAEAFDALLAAEHIALDAVVAFDMPLDHLVTRVLGRRTCERCHGVYHSEARPPARENVCGRCGGALKQRDDDRPAAVRVRMDAYMASTAPLLAYYRAKGLLVEVSAEGTPAEICARVLTALESRDCTGLAV